ncbi:cbb3-type cytochrome oxidase assembly protein CcoS [Hyphobacterium sp.]|jgi:cbb3-type cytochrome oxidase maturation protein|uniref:cbb3-type cytochrome oxidase assembly protein CcoS n=1 Tax=Hyphobacterium sp. TaxID=2004662 RepID=UPI003BAC7AB6
MDVLIFLIPIALGLGLAGLGAFLWSLRSGQYEDLDGAAQRILIDDDDRPLEDGDDGLPSSETDGD